MVKKTLAAFSFCSVLMQVALSHGLGPAPAPAAISPVNGAAAAPTVPSARDVRVIVSVHDQKLAVVVNGKVSRSYRVSTSRYGEGDALGSWRTPLGHLEVAHKIGGLAPVGSVFKGRQPTGEVLPSNAPGRDPIVSRIIWLRGLEQTNRHAYQRCIYIHGTPQESFLGRKASFGCIRMRSADVVDVYRYLNVGTDVSILPESLGRAVKDLRGDVAKVLTRNTVARLTSPGSSIRSE